MKTNIRYTALALLSFTITACGGFKSTGVSSQGGTESLSSAPTGGGLAPTTGGVTQTGGVTTGGSNTGSVAPTSNPVTPLPPARPRGDSPAVLPPAPAAAPSAPSSAPPAPSVAPNFDVLRPVIFSVSAESEAECDRIMQNAAPELPASLIKCSVAANGRGYKTVIMPNPSRNDSSTLNAIYASTDITYPQLKNAAEFLRGLYVNMLGRQPDVGGYYYWLNDYFGGQSREFVTQGVHYLPESIIVASNIYWMAYASSSDINAATAYVRMLYRAVLGREGYDYEVNWYVGQLTTGAQTADHIKAEFYGSTEFVNKMRALNLVPYGI